MFIKPFRVKSSSQMKGSDKKKFKADIRKKFKYFTDPDVDQDALNDLIPNKEELVVTKIETFSGDAVLLYHRGSKNVLFFELEKDKLIFPTLWTLWQHPDLAPTMTTHSPVVKKLANGADLMLPGVIIDENLGMKAYGDINKDDVISVNLAENKAPVAVGMAALSSEDMYMCGRRGKALKIMHCIGDQLYLHYGKPQLPELGVPANLEFLQDFEDDVVQGGRVLKDVLAKNETDTDEIETEENEVSEQIEDLNIEENFEIIEKPEEETVEEIELDPDTILEEAFLRACKTLPKKTEFPILTSNFFRTLIVPNLPPSHPNLDLKKTKWKKLSKFLSEKQSEGLITIKEPKKGVETITAINTEHAKIQDFKVVKYDRPVTDDGSKVQDEFEPPIITELYLVSGQDVMLFFKELGIAKGTGMTPQDVRECIRNYVNKNELQNVKDKSIVNLDPVLAQAVLVKGENNVVTMKWDKLTSRITTKMSKGVAIQYGADSQPILLKGKLDLIEMTLGSRSGNKKVTLIHNLDVFGIDPKEFAHKCQVGVSASSTVSEAANKKKSNGSPVIEVLVQGNQVAYAGKLLLEHYKINKKYIRGLELAKKAKK